jgi:tetratricopeptide (TPR) repeat protein
VTGYPTILFLNGDGKVEGIIVGYKPADGFSQDLTKFVTAHRDLPALEARYKANPADATTAAKLASIYAGKGEIQKAEAALANAAKADPGNSTGLLASTYNAIGDYYQEKHQIDKAVPEFEKGAKAAKTPYDRAYAYISIAACRFEQQKPKDAIPALDAVLATKGAPAEFTDQAKQMLAAAKQAPK